MLNDRSTFLSGSDFSLSSFAGYYADPETRCQTFHVCTSGGSTSNSFLCPNGTLFNTAVRTCDWWPAVDCGSFSDSLRLNQDIAKQKTNPSAASRSQPLRSRPPKVRRPSSEIASPEGSLHTSEIRHTVHHTPQQYVSEKYENSLAKDEQRAEGYSQRRRPKPFLSALRKQKQRLRVTTQATRFDAEENYPTEIPPKPSTLRSTPLRRTNFTPRPLTVTRFDFTSETLEFPSMRTTPSRSSLNRGKNFESSANSRQTTRISSSSAPSDSKTQNQERPFTSSRNSNGRRKYKASRLVTQAPSTTGQPLRGTRPQPLRVTENYPAGAPLSGGFDNYLPSPRTPIHFTPHIPLEVTSPRIEQNYLPKGDERLFNYPVTTEAAPREEAIRPIVVASPDQGSDSYSTADANAFSQYNLGQSSNEFNPHTNAEETSFVFSQANSKSISEDWVTSTPAFARSTSSGTAEEPLSFVTRNPQPFSSAPNAKNGLGLGLTKAFFPTQSTFVIPPQKSSEQTYFTTLDDSKSITPQQFNSPESLQKTVSHEDIGITQSLPPTTATFHIPHSVSVERGAAENLRTLSKGNSHTPSRQDGHYNPTSTGSAKSFFPSQETAKLNTQYHPTTITGTQSFSPTQPTAIHPLQSQQNNGSLFTGTTQSLSPSEADSNELVEEKEEFSPPPSGHSFSSAQAISGSSDFNNNFVSYPFAFANSLANAFLSNAEFNQQTTASPIASPSLSPTPSSVNTASQSTATQATFPGPTDYQRRSRPSLSNFVNSFASANAFVSDEGYSQSSSTTPSSASAPTSSTTKSLNPTQALPSSTLKTTSTTPKLLYTPTVPQTTARPLTTETPSKKSFLASKSVTTSPKTTAFVPQKSANIPKIPSFDSQNATFSTTTRQPIAFSPTTSATPSTTKKLKGFYITHPPPTRSTSPKAPNKEPKNTYLPQLRVTLSAPTLPSTYSYQPPSSKIPDFYNRPSPAATKSTYSTSSVDSVKSVSHALNPSSFNPQEQTSYRQPQYSGIYGPPIPSPPSTNEPPREMKRVSTTTEPSFVIQKSVELFAAHEVAFHPSVFSQSSYSLSSLQDDYKTGGDNRPALIPPPFLVPSPKARGFEKWNTEDHTDKLTHPRAS
ncbi:hypothetical protein J437_LFUL013357 [Ladona fulva]|uniref:Chitin-binding type-2 domain-containing protein n=1 Tax=Ladona fulva TaxID=123851 RepID=A0A8K0KGN2_LADFU|nr:hypothetical protein J437_LFUL013357 [Ladona fulva]